MRRRDDVPSGSSLIGAPIERRYFKSSREVSADAARTSLCNIAGYFSGFNAFNVARSPEMGCDLEGAFGVPFHFGRIGSVRFRPGPDHEGRYL